jgi:uncharacterized protein YndB with AHSA1/START domain
VAKTLTYSNLVRGGTQSYEKIGKVSSQSVLKHTGKGWEAWVGVLEKAGARSWTYQEIVAHLKKRHRLTPWWQQGVALGFEIAIGRRKAGQDAKGKYMVTATKSLHLEVKTVWRKMLSPAGLDLWLRPLSAVRVRPKTFFETKDGFFGEIRTVTPNRKLRMSWKDPLWEKPTVVEAILVPKPGKKCILAFNHTGIPDERARETLRARWREAADQIAG